MNYLDLSGLQRLWDKIKDKLNNCLLKTGGTVSGDIIHYMDSPSNRGDAFDSTLPYVGTWAKKTLPNDTEFHNAIQGMRSFFGTLQVAGRWRSVISIRHKNGSSDGTKYGMYLKSTFGNNSLFFGNQNGTWLVERMLWDNVNLTKISQLSNDKNYTTIDDVKTNVLPGKGNLLYNSDFSAPFESNNPQRWAVNYQCVKTVNNHPNNFDTAIDIWGKANAGIYCSPSEGLTLLYPLKVGATYTLSFYAKSSTTLNVIAGEDGNSPAYISVSNITWKRYYTTFVCKSATSAIIIRPTTTNHLYLAGVQLEFGNTPSEWDNTFERIVDMI